MSRYSYAARKFKGAYMGLFIHNVSTLDGLYYPGIFRKGLRKTIKIFKKNKLYIHLDLKLTLTNMKCRLMPLRQHPPVRNYASNIHHTENNVQHNDVVSNYSHRDIESSQCYILYIRNWTPISLLYDQRVLHKGHIHQSAVTDIP